MPSPVGEHDHPKEQRFTVTQVGRYVLGLSLLRNILLACLAVAALFPLYHGFVLTPAYHHLLTRLSEDEARRTAVHLIRTLGIGHMPLDQTSLKPELLASIANLKADFQLEKLKIFDPAGRVLFSTEPGELNTINRNPYFTDKVAKGEICSHLVVVGGSSTFSPSHLSTVHKALITRSVIGPSTCNSASNGHNRSNRARSSAARL